ncbi:hypothetical protein Lal_00027932 [Lupinus albus]|nr:hypothetical protein Lal_00027932 [Lupinus albus]
MYELPYVVLVVMAMYDLPYVVLAFMALYDFPNVVNVQKKLGYNLGPYSTPMGPSAHEEPSKDVIRVRHLNLFEEQPLLNDLLQFTGGGQNNVNYQGIPRGDLMGYRSCLDHRDVNNRLPGRTLVQQVVSKPMVRLGHGGLKWERNGKHGASLVALHSSHTPVTMELSGGWRLPSGSLVQQLPYETYINNLSCEVQQDKKICHNHQIILMPYIELTNGLIKTQTGQPSMHSGLNIEVVAGIKSYKDLKSNILSTHHNI